MMAAHGNSPDPWTAERLVTGHLDPDDAPPGYRRVAHLLQAAATAPSEQVVDTAADPIGAIAAVIHTQLQTQPPSRARRSPVFGKALIAVSAAILSASAAGAATGHLPDSVQDTVADAVDHIGVNLPQSDDAAVNDKGVERVIEDCVPAADGTFARNRGQYLKQERAKSQEAFEAAKKTRCGMPIQSQGTPGADEAPGTEEAPETPAVPGAQDSDHGKADDEHGKADDEHGKADDEHGKADDEHGKADEDHGKADEDHGQADSHPTPDSHPGGRP